MRISLSAPSLVLLLVGSHGASAAQMDVRDLIGGLFGTHPTTTSSSAASTATAATEKSAGLMSNLLNGLLGTGSSSSSEGVLGDLLDPISSVMSDVASNAQSINQAISTSAAKKRPKQRVPSCATYSSIGGPCGNSPRQCCSTGLTCSQNTCQLLCPASTTLPYCDTSSDCDATYGLVCKSMNAPLGGR